MHSKVEEMQMMANVNEWPGAVLPIKKYERKGEFPACATLMPHESEPPFVVYLEDMFTLGAMPKEEWAKVKKIQFNSLAEIVDEGWVVD